MTDKGPLPAPGSDANPIEIEATTASPRSVEEYDHVHDISGRCLKRRAGERCPSPVAMKAEAFADIRRLNETPELQGFLERGRTEMLPRVRGSAVAMVAANGLDGEIDLKMALEIGAMLLLDKPIIVVCGQDQQIPSALERAAVEVVRGELGDPVMHGRIQDAIARHCPST